MNDNFWKKLNKPIIALAPMAGINDQAFRVLCKENGADVIYSEMASVTALVYGPEKTLEMLKFEEMERPYVVQVFGNNPEHFAKGVRIIEKNIQPDGFDINFGCPVKKVQKQGAGAVLMKDFELARKCIEAVIENTNLPVSIKVRTKVDSFEMLDFLDFIKDLDIKALMIHGRTLKEGFVGDINTDIIKEARNHFDGVILANGGINNYKEGERVLEETESDGLGIARGAMGRPWIFKEIKEKRDIKKEMNEVYEVIKRHAEIIEREKGDHGIVEMRKHLCWYVHGLSGARGMRQRLVEVKSFDDIKKVFE